MQVMGVPSRLTEMQMKFCEILVFGSKDGPVSGTEAAIQAGYSPDRARFTASELQSYKKYPKSAAYIAELRKEKLEKFEVNYENHIARLGNLGIKSEKKGNMQAAIRAEELRGKAKKQLNAPTKALSSSSHKKSESSSDPQK